MSGLGPIDIDMILDLFEGSRGRGYVLEFSDRTFTSFMLDVAAINVDAPRYKTDGTSKGRRLRAFLATAPESTVVKVLNALWQYRARYVEEGRCIPVPDGGERLAQVVRSLYGRPVDGMGHTRTQYAKPDPVHPDREIDPDRQALGDLQQAFWREFLAVLRFSDPEQPIPRPPRQGYLNVMMPAPGRNSWLTVYRDMRKNEVGLFLSATRNSAGEYTSERLVEDFAAMGPQLGGDARIAKDSYGRQRIGEHASFGSLTDAEKKARAFAWLAERTDTYVNVLRPQIRSAVADYVESHGDAGS